MLDVEFSATRLRELAKMDGAIVVDRDCTKILRAAVQLVPDPAIPTDESGTRHRTADRVNKQTGLPVISVSQSMSIIALYVDGQRYVLEDSTQILSRANQALATLERYKLRLDEVSGTLSALEIEDLVTVRDVSAVAQRLEMVRRIAGEIESLRRRARHRRPAAHPAARRADRRRRARPRADRPRLPAGAQRPPVPHRRPTCWPTSTGSTRSSCSTSPRSPAPWATAAARASTPRSARAATACWPGCRACPASSSTGWSSTSAACRSCSPPASTTCRPSTGVGESRARSVREGLSRLAESSILERYV